MASEDNFELSDEETSEVQEPSNLELKEMLVDSKIDHISSIVVSGSSSVLQTNLKPGNSHNTLKVWNHFLANYMFFKNINASNKLFYKVWET